MAFESRGCVFNPCERPGDGDFFEDTYRTLTAVEAAVMAEGIEEQTRCLSGALHSEFGARNSTH